MGLVSKLLKDIIKEFKIFLDPYKKYIFYFILLLFLIAYPFYASNYEKEYF